MTRRIITIVLFLTLVGQVLAQSKADRYANHSVLASGKWVKIRVANEGIYALTKSRLQKMGFNNPEKVSLYGYNLPVLPETKIENLSDDLTEIPLWRRSDGSLLFYSCGTVKWERKSAYSNFTRTNNPYSTAIYYFLTEKTEGAPAKMSQTLVQPSSTQNKQTTFPEHTLIEKDEISIINTGRSFLESYDYVNGNKRTYTMLMPGIADENIMLTVQFVAGTGSSLTVTADSTTFPSFAFRNVVDYEYGIMQNRTFSYKKQLVEKSSITLTHTRTAGISGHLDYLLGCYTRNLDMSNVKYLTFRPTGSTSNNQYAISGADENTRVWLVSSPEQTCEIGGTYLNGIYTVCTEKDDYRNEYVAVNTAATFPEPETVETVKNQDLHALSNIDLVIIVPASGKLTAQAQRLADAHTKYDNMRCVVVRADQIYNEFSSGTPDATAYRRFMKMLYDKAETEEDRPKNLCLFGDGLWDNRMITTNLRKGNPDNFLLCYESENSLSHTESYVSEEYYTLLADGKGVSILKETPDCGVGRITVSTPNEARGVVDKLVNYISNQNAGVWKNTICFMGDDGDTNTHMTDADAVANMVEASYPDFRIRKIYWDYYRREESGAGHTYPDVTNDINDQMENGALIMNYTGHGSAYILSHEQVIKRADFEKWDSPRTPLWFIAACDVTPFDMNEENIAETALLNEKGGAVSIITTTRTVYAAQNKKINLAFMKDVLSQKTKNRPYTIGEALAQAKSDIINSGSLSKRDSINKVHYVLIGDPAISLRLPTYKVKVDKLNNINVSSSIQTIGAGAIVSVEGHIVDETGNVVTDFNGTVSPTIFDNVELIICHNNANEDVQPFRYKTRVRTLYAGVDSVRQGYFNFTFPVPLDINYSEENGLMSLYAVGSEESVEAHGTFDDFLIGGTDANLSDDKQGPQLAIRLNDEYFTNTSDAEALVSNVLRTATITMHETPYFVGVIKDENGINTVGSGVGHEISLIVDNDPHMTYNLNNSFQYVNGTWTTGTVSCSLPELSTGSHTLLFRAWDILNNPSILEVTFNVQKGLKPNVLGLTINSPVRNNQLSVTIENDRPSSQLNINIQIFDMSGREVWRGGETGVSNSNYYTYTCNLNGANGHLPPGIYICKASISTANGVQASDAKKFVVTAQ